MPSVSITLPGQVARRLRLYACKAVEMVEGSSGARQEIIVVIHRQRVAVDRYTDKPVCGFEE